MKEMKKIVSLLFVLCCISNTQSMQLPEQLIDNKYLMSKSFLEYKISAHEYLSYIASLSPEYAYKIRAIRNMQPSNINQQISYSHFLELLENYPLEAQRVFLLSGAGKYQQMIQGLLQEIMEDIDRCYQSIERDHIRYGRES